jgi:hypothetical protein
MQRRKGNRKIGNSQTEVCSFNPFLSSATLRVLCVKIFSSSLYGVFGFASGLPC